MTQPIQPPPSQATFTINLDHETAAALERPLEIIGRNLGLDSDDTLAHILAIGALKTMADITERHERQILAATAIPKLKAEENVSIEELDAIFAEAKAGNLECAIVMEDFKRFGRSMEKRPNP